MKKLKIDHVNLDQRVYCQLKSMILDQTLQSGSKIYQKKLAEDLGVSRTPLVNALKKLEQEYLITAIPQKGFYVRGFSKEAMVYIFELREVLEGLAARRASLCITDDQIQQLQNLFTGLKKAEAFGSVEKYAKEDRRFHHFLIKISGDDLLSSILETYRVITFSHMAKFRGGLARPPQETLPEHLTIVEAIIKKDPEMAEQLVRLHFKRSRARLIQSLEEEPQKDFQSN